MSKWLSATTAALPPTAPQPLYIYSTMSPSTSKIAMPISNVGAETSAQGAASSYATPTTEIPPAAHDSAPPSRKGSIPNTIASDTATVSLPHAVVAQLEKAEGLCRSCLS